MAPRSLVARKSWVASTAARQISMMRGRSEAMEGRKTNMLYLNQKRPLSRLDGRVRSLIVGRTHPSVLQRTRRRAAIGKPNGGR